MPIISGIYEIRNIENGHRYIGSSNNIYKRFNEHRCVLNKNDSHCRILQNAWNKYERDIFKFSVLLVCDIDMLLYYEQIFLDRHPRYNISECAEATTRGIKKTKEQIKRMSESQIGKKLSEETKRKISAANKGQIPWMKGRHHSEETKIKLSESQKGKRCTEESKSKMRKPKSVEAKENIRLGAKKRYSNPEERIKASVRMKEYYRRKLVKEEYALE